MRSAVFVTFSRRLFHVRRVKRSYENPRYLLKWLLISTPPSTSLQQHFWGRSLAIFLLIQQGKAE